jgi:hypothetical protein
LQNALPDVSRYVHDILIWWYSLVPT